MDLNKEKASFADKVAKAQSPIEINGVFYKLKCAPKGKELFRLQRITGVLEAQSLLAEILTDKEFVEKHSAFKGFDENSTIADLPPEAAIKFTSFIYGRIEEFYDEFWQFFQFSFDGKEYRDLSTNNVVQYEALETDTTAMAQLGVYLLVIASVFTGR